MLVTLRPVMKAIAANQQRMTLNTLSLVGFPPLRALLSSTGMAPWGQELPSDPESRTRPLLPPFKPDCIVKEAIQKAASMGEVTPSEMRRRLSVRSTPGLTSETGSRTRPGEPTGWTSIWPGRSGRCSLP